MRAYVSGRRYVEFATCVPVPEKAQAQYMFCVFPLNTDGTNNHSSADIEPAEQILWTIPNTTLKPSQVSGELIIETEDTYRSLLLRVLNRCLAPFHKQVEVPNEKEFASQTAQVYKKGEKAVHVKAFRGSKDGRSRLLVRWNETRKCNLLDRSDLNSNIPSKPTFENRKEFILSKKKEPKRKILLTQPHQPTRLSLLPPNRNILGL